MGKTKKICILCSRTCSISGCSITFHKFPKNPDSRKLWCKACNLSETTDVNNLLVCSNHFEQPKDYLLASLTDRPTRQLKKNVVPHLNLNLKLEPPAACLHEIQPRKSTYKVLPSSSYVVTTSNIPQSCATENPDSKNFVNQNPIIESKPDAAEETTPKRRWFEPRYINEIQISDVSTPKKAKTVIFLIKNHALKQTKKIKALHDQNRKLRKRIAALEASVPQQRKLNVLLNDAEATMLDTLPTNLEAETTKLNNEEQPMQEPNPKVCKQITSFKGLILHLRKKDMLSEDAGTTISDILSPSIKHLVACKLKNKGKYSPSLRSFALTLNFYSSRAYSYVRKIWGNLLPRPSTIRDWYKVVDGNPGFTAEALKAISARVKDKHVFCNIIIDEMSIQEQLIFNDNRFYGGIDYGCNSDIDMDNTPLARKALVFMAVALNDNWKVPIAYFFISSLNGQERANILNQCLAMVERTGVEVYSITVDGTATNLNMCTALGANFTYGSNFKPFFKRKGSTKNIYIFFDLCHMIKLIRNTLGDKKLLQIDENCIKWEFIEKLYSYQKTQGLVAANKLTKQHINYQNNRMNSKLAMQTFSNSVSVALEYLYEYSIEGFQECDETARFCKMFNDISDFLNCKNVSSSMILTSESCEKLKDFADEAEHYIKDLTDENNTPILKSRRKTGFLGIIVNLQNIFKLYNVLNKKGLGCLLTFRLSQDFIQTFFDALRNIGNFNDNPNAMQFQKAYKRLLMLDELKEIEAENCISTDSDDEKSCNTPNSVESAIVLDQSFDHDYVTTIYEVNPYIEEVLG